MRIPEELLRKVQRKLNLMHWYEVAEYVATLHLRIEELERAKKERSDSDYARS